MLSGAQLLIQALEAQGVEYIFGIPGAKIDAAFDALVDSHIRLILCRHEQNAAFMAGCYGRLTGKPGVVLVTSGPGVSNLATGLLTATTEGDPIVAIGGNVARSMKLNESHQGCDNVKLMEAATKYCVEAVLPENIPEIVANAFRIATQPRSGAAFISIPQDVLMATSARKIISPLMAIAQNRAHNNGIQLAFQYLTQARCPVVLLGQEASRPENTIAIRQLLHHHLLPVVSTYQAAGVISRDLLSCFVGRVGLFKNQPGDRLLDNADVILTVGYNPVEYDPEIWNAGSNKTIIHLDYNPASLHSTYLPKVELIGAIDLTLNRLKDLLPQTSQLNQEELVVRLQAELNEKKELEQESHHHLIHPLSFIQQLTDAINDDTMVISDIGTHYMWLARYFFTHQPHHLLFSNGQQTLGVALPWAIATKLVVPKRQVISISGDGGFLFSSMELETAVRLKLNLIHFVWCDHHYNMVQEQQLIKYKRDYGVQFGAIDIVKYAESFGAVGVKLGNNHTIKNILKEAAERKMPTLIEVPIDYSDNKELFLTVNQNVGH